MKMKFLLGCLMMGCISYVSAQSVAFVYEGKQQADGATIEYRSTEAMMMCNVSVKNLTDAPVTLRVRKEEMNDFAASCLLSAFCVNGCSASEYSEPFTVEAGTVFDDNGNMHGQVLAHTYGTAIVKYELIGENNEPETSVTVNYIYSSGEGIEDVQDLRYIRILPAAGGVDIAYDLEAESSFVVTDMTGRTVYQVMLPGNTGIYPLPLEKGLYVYSVIQDGRRNMARKFIVK